MIKHAFILGAGFGSRMRPLTETTPKPLIKLGGKALIDHVIEGLVSVGVEQIIVNVHYLADQLEAHLKNHAFKNIIISDERAELLDTGGGAFKALHHFNNEPFFIHNSDSVWIEHGAQPEGISHNLSAMVKGFDASQMDCLMLLANRHNSLGYSGKGDFLMDQHQLIKRRPKEMATDHVFAGVSINTTDLFANSPEGAFSLNLLWDKSIEQGRVKGIPHQGKWMHVGTKEALAEAEACLIKAQQTA